VYERSVREECTRGVYERECVRAVYESSVREQCTRAVYESSVQEECIVHLIVVRRFEPGRGEDRSGDVKRSGKLASFVAWENVWQTHDQRYAQRGVEEVVFVVVNTVVEKLSAVIGREDDQS
jgi:hypothetical protein